MKKIVKLFGIVGVILLVTACSSNKLPSDIETDIKTDVGYQEDIQDENINQKNDIKIDDELVEIIMQNLNDNSHEVPLDNEKIYQYKYSELETGEPWEYLFDIDNDGIEDKIEIHYGTGFSFCNNISWGTGNSKYILGSYNGGIYDESISLSEIEETQIQVVKLDFFRYKDYNYILDSSTTTANYEIRLYHNKELVDVVNIRNTKNKEYSVTVGKESDLEEVLKSEGEKILKDNECNYPLLCYGNAEENGDRITTSTADINNDGELEEIYKTSSGGLGQFFYYGINGEIDSKYFENLGLCKNTLYGFWIDNINNINVLKMIEYDWDNDIAYFRCYIVKNENADLIFEMRRKDNLTFFAE